MTTAAEDASGPQAWLIDKSALVKLAASPDRDLWIAQAHQGAIHVAAVTVLELGYSVRSADEHAQLTSRPPLSTLPVEHSSAAIEQRALIIQGLLAQRGHHRAPSVADLIIAATAELLGLAVLHHDKDFELISDVTGIAQTRLRLD